MDKIQGSTRDSYQWPLVDQHNYEEIPSTSDRPSSSHTFEADHLHHPQYEQPGTSAHPYPAHYPAASVEYFVPDGYYHQSQSHPIARPRAIFSDTSNSWQSELYSSAVSSQSSHPPPFEPFARLQAEPFDSSHPWQPRPYTSSFSSYHEPQPVQPIARPQAKPWDPSNQWQYDLYSPAIVPHRETLQPHDDPTELPQATPSDFSAQHQPELSLAEVSSHPETLQFPSIEASALRIQQTEEQLFVPYLKETSNRIKDNLVPFNHLISSHSKMIIHQFRILPALQNNMMPLDDIIKFISYPESGDPHARLVGFKRALQKYQLGSLMTFTDQGIWHGRFKSDLNSSNYAHLLRVLDIMTPLETTYDLKRSTIGFCRNLYYFTNRPQVSRAMIAKDYGFTQRNIADMVIKFSRAAETANIGVIEFKNVDWKKREFIKSEGNHGARYYHWKPA